MKIKNNFENDDFAKNNEIQKAKKYAEGLEEMEALLIFLWNNNISTFDCGVGSGQKYSDAKQTANPYISIDATSFSDEEYKNLLTMLLTLKDVSKIECFSGKNKKGVEERSLLIEVENMPEVIKKLHGIIYDAILKIASCNFNHLEKEDKRFVETALVLKNLNVGDLTLSDYKKHYKNLPEKVENVSILKNKNGTEYKVSLDDSGIETAIGRNVSYVCNAAYTKLPNDYCLMIGRNGSASYVSESKIKKLGLIEVEYYLKLKHKLFEKDSSAFNDLLNCKSQAQPQNE